MLFGSENVTQLIGLLQMQNDLVLCLILRLKLGTPADEPNCRGVCLSHKQLMHSNSAKWPSCSYTFFVPMLMKS